MSLHSDAATVPADAQAAGNSVSHANAYLLYRLIGLYRLFPSLSIGNLLRIKIPAVNTASVNKTVLYDAANAQIPVHSVALRLHVHAVPASAKSALSGFLAQMTFVHIASIA